MQDMLTDPLANIVLMHADDKLMLGHIQSDWTGLAPILEEDIAASSMAQDDLSHALVLYEFLGARFSLDPDAIAFDRDPCDYRCCDLVTIPDEFDWATSVVKRWLIATFSKLGLVRLTTLREGDLGDRANRLVDEQAIQVAHLNSWMTRLGRGSTESHDRMQASLDLLSSSAGMMFEPPGATLAEDDSFCCGRDELFAEWVKGLGVTLDAAGLSATITLPNRSTCGGRRGEHASHFNDQLSELTEVRHSDPATSW